MAVQIAKAKALAYLEAKANAPAGEGKRTWKRRQTHLEAKADTPADDGKRIWKQSQMDT